MDSSWWDTKNLEVFCSQTAPVPLIFFGEASQDLKGKMLCLLVCFLLTHLSLSSDPVPVLLQHLTQSMLLGDAGMC
jgi:hypothetical protein